MKLKRYEGNPIISPIDAHDWENLVASNPGAWYDEEKQEVILLYRASGRDAEFYVHFGMAVSKDGYNFERVSDKPVFSPSIDGFDAGCVEDPRIVKMGEWYYITYASRPFPPGEYWMAPEQRRYNPPKFPADFPLMLRNNATTTGLLLTKDFKTFIRAGRLTNPTLDDRDVILFPEKINGKFVMLHRPMNWVGEQYGTEHPAIWISTSDDVLNWESANSKMLATAKYEWELKIGGSTPPLKTEHGWLTLYHGVGSEGYYRVGAFLLDLNDPSKILHRSPDWLLQPEEKWEFEGYYNGVVFPCGNVIIGDTLFVYYGGADKHVGVATCSVKELLADLLSCPRD